MNILKLLTCLFCISMLVSCSQDESQNNPALEEKFFEKTTEVADEAGNVAFVNISSKDQSLVESFDVNTLELVTTTKSFNISNTELNSSENNIIFEDDPTNTLYINVVDREFDETITGFAVRIKKDGEGLSFRQDVFTDFGADDVRGAQVLFTEEERASCWLEIDLGRKNNCNAWGWVEMSDGRLEDVGQIWGNCSSVEYCEYRLRVDGRGWRCTNDDNTDYDWLWVLNC